MAKKIVLLLLVSLLLVTALAPAATAAISEEQEETIQEIHQKIADLRQQLIDIYLDAGIITEEQAEQARERMEMRAERRAEQDCALGMGRKWFHKGPGKGLGRPSLQETPAPAVD